jgi:hypothetical protein
MTHVAKVNDNWFYYWKTSASLWKEKIESFPFNNIIVPIFWAFHVEKPNKYDFGLQRPETDLKIIHEIGQELGKKIIFFLPIGPAPIFSHGGLPPHLIGTLSQNPQGHAYAVLNKEKIYNKIYSYFDPNIFKEFGNFVKVLGEYFETEKISRDLYGIDSGYFNNKSFVSFFNDRSNCFHKSFAKYIETSMEEDLFPGIKSPQEERKEIKKFTTFIFSLYRKVAQENLQKNWEGELRVVFLGGSTKDFISRAIAEDRMNYFNDVLSGINQECLPSIALIELENDLGIFSKQFNDIVIDTYIPWKFSSSFMEDINYSPLSFFKIFEDENNNIQKNGILAYLEENFGNTFSHFSFEQERNPSFSNDGNIYFIPGSKIDKDQFSKILKFFLNGGKVFVDCQELSPEIKNKMDSFLLENSLKIDKIKFHVNFENVTLGEGRLFLFKGNEFKSIDFEKKKEFWHKVLANMDISHFHLESIPNIKFFWKTRSASPGELNFQEIRRVFIYNSDKSKKKIKGILRKNISLIKIEPEVEKRYENQSDKIEFEIPPQSWILADFGIWA